MKRVKRGKIERDGSTTAEIEKERMKRGSI